MTPLPTLLSAERAGAAARTSISRRDALRFIVLGGAAIAAPRVLTGCDALDPLGDARSAILHADDPSFGYRRDRSQLAAALDAAGEAAARTGNRHTVFVSRGIWTLDDTLFVPSRVTLRLHDEAVLRLTAIARSGHGAVQNARDARGVHVVGGTVDCNDVGAASTPVKGITLLQSSQFRVERVRVLNSQSYGIWITDDRPYVTPGYGVVEGCYVRNCEESIELLGTRQVSVLRNEVEMVEGRSLNGILLYSAGLGDQCTENLVEGNTIRGHGTGIAIVAGAGDNLVRQNDVRVHGASRMGLYIGENAGERNRVEGGVFRSENARGIIVGSATGVRIEDVQVDGWCGAVYGGTGSRDLHLHRVVANSRSTPADVNQAIELSGLGGSVTECDVRLQGNTEPSLGGRAIRAGEGVEIASNVAAGAVMVDHWCSVVENRIVDAPLQLYGANNVARDNLLIGPRAIVQDLGENNEVERNEHLS